MSCDFCGTQKARRMRITTYSQTQSSAATRILMIRSRRRSSRACRRDDARVFIGIARHNRLNNRSEEISNGWGPNKLYACPSLYTTKVLERIYPTCNRSARDRLADRRGPSGSRSGCPHPPRTCCHLWFGSGDTLPSTHGLVPVGIEMDGERTASAGEVQDGVGFV